LAYNQVTNSANAGFNYNTGSDKVKHVVFGNGTYQRANDNHENGSVFYNANAGYQYGFTPIGLNVTLSANYNNAVIKETTTQSVGPNLAVSKLLFKKLVRTTIAVTYLETYTNGTKNGNNSMYRFATSYKRGKHHTVTFDVAYMSRKLRTGTNTNYSEIRANLIYGFTF